MAIKCLIVDDEPLACEILESYVSRIDSLDLVGTHNNAISAFEFLRKAPVDLVFLDIQMPRLTGIEFIKALNPPPKVIFTTAYREYAVESYELNVVDYLLKPIAFNRFLMAINKVTESENPHPSESAEEDDNPYLYVKADRKMVKVFLRSISRIESLKDYIRIKTDDGKEVITLQKIGYIEQKLPEDCFLRIHRSYIVPISKIDAFNTTHVEIGDQKVPIGRNYKSEVMKRLKADDSIIK